MGTHRRIRGCHDESAPRLQRRLFGLADIICRHPAPQGRAVTSGRPDDLDAYPGHAGNAEATCREGGRLPRGERSQRRRRLEASLRSGRSMRPIVLDIIRPRRREGSSAFVAADGRGGAPNRWARCPSPIPARPRQAPLRLARRWRDRLRQARPLPGCARRRGRHGRPATDDRRVHRGVSARREIPAFYQATTESLPALQAAGMRTFRVGHEAHRRTVGVHSEDPPTSQPASHYHASPARRRDLRIPSRLDAEARERLLPGLLHIDARWRKTAGPPLGFTIGGFDPAISTRSPSPSPSKRRPALGVPRRSARLATGDGP